MDPKRLVGAGVFLLALSIAVAFLTSGLAFVLAVFLLVVGLGLAAFKRHHERRLQRG